MKRRKKQPKRERRERAALGGSAVARLAFERPGGSHGRRRKPRRVERERAIQDAGD